MPDVPSRKPGAYLDRLPASPAARADETVPGALREGPRQPARSKAGESRGEGPARLTGRGRVPVCYAFSASPWHGPWMNRQQILTRLARRGWPVIYSNGALDFWDRKSPAWRSRALFGRQEESYGVRVDQAGRFLPVWPSRPRYSAWAIARYCAALRRRGHLPAGKEGIAYIFLPEFLPYALSLGCRYLVYHAVDDYSRMPGWTRELDRLQREAVARADLVLATTAATLSSLPPGGSAPRHVLQNGADAAAFALGPELLCPEDLARIPEPRICYTGILNRKVDFNLVAAVARERPAWQWVLVGPTIQGIGHPSRDPELAHAYDACCRLPNVHFLGVKTVAELPAYVGHADVNVMCYRQGEGGWWNSVYPLKLHEYLAAGRPVVSSPLPSVRPFAHVLDLAGTEADWIRAVDRALLQGGVGSLEERRAVARENTWDLRVDQLEQWLIEMVSARSRVFSDADA